MHCPHCQTDNRENARFCKRCGSYLGSQCPDCSQSIPPGSHFCDQCGYPLNSRLNVTQPVSEMQVSVPGTPEIPVSDSPTSQKTSADPDLGSFIPAQLATKLASARASNAMAGERRIVTMLFCDIQGSTKAAGELDPEDWTAIMNEAFEFMIRPVYRYEGTVARLMGDAILAFFGAPIAHEDDPQRAILAGLDIIAEFQPYRDRVRAEWGVDVNVRVGINTGLVVVGAVGSDLRMEYTALGDAINLAARMEQTAEPGTVRVSEETYRLVAPVFDFEKLGQISVKGKDEPVQSYQVIGRKSQPGRLRGIAGLRSPLVGRDPEMGMIERVFNDLKDGKGQVMSIIGEAGLGKSRLLKEAQVTWRRLFEQQTNEPGLPPAWTMSQGISFENGIPYGHWQQHIRQVCGIKDADGPDEVREKIDQQIVHWPEEHRDAAGKTYRSILSGSYASGKAVDGGSEIVRQELRALLAESFRMSASRQAGGFPPVVIFDDLHWADPASVDLLMDLFQLTNEVPILFLMIFRPERKSGAWEARESASRNFADRYTEINLRPLSRSEGDQLVSHLLHVADLKDDLRAFIQDRVDGNPFFIEEVVRTLIDQGHVVRVTGDSAVDWRGVGKIDQITVPDNLQNLLMSRIDRLDEETRQVLQLASVIGRKFYYRVLQIISETIAHLDQRLNELRQAELIRETSRLPELEYMFRHTLTQETTYKSILRQRRRDFHLRVGRALEELFPERLDEFAALLAQHFDEGQDEVKALHYHRMAADRAFAIDAQVEAQSHYERAIELSPSSQDLESLTFLYHRRGRSLELQGNLDAALENYAEMTEVAARSGSKAMHLSALTSRGTIHSTATVHFNVEVAARISEEALLLARELDDVEAEARIYWNKLNSYRLSNLNDEAADAGRKAIRLAEEHDLTLILAYAKNDMSHVLMSYDVLGALDMFLEAITLWRRLGNRPMLTDGLASYALYAGMVGEYEKSFAAGKEAWEISEAIQNTWGKAFSTESLAMVYAQTGKWDQAIETCLMSVEWAQQAGFIVGEILGNMILLTTYLMIGATEQANQLMARNEVFKQHPSARFAMFTRSFQAMVLLSQGELDAAAETLESIEDSDHANIYGRTLWKLAAIDLALAQGEYEKVIALSYDNHKVFEKASSRPYIAENLYARARAYQSLGRPNDALEAIEQALDIVQETGQQPLRSKLLMSQSSILSEAGESQVAEKLLEEARRIVLSLSQNIAEPELREIYLKSMDMH